MRRPRTSAATLRASSDGSGTTRLGGEAMRTTLKPSPPAPSSTTFKARARARSKQVCSPFLTAMLSEPSTTMMRCVRVPPASTPLPPAGLSQRQRDSAQGVTEAMARTIRSTTRQRRARRISCSRRIRRAFLRWAQSRKRMAAHSTTRKRRRLSRWMMMGMETAPPATAAAVSGVSKRTANRGMMNDTAVPLLSRTRQPATEITGQDQPRRRVGAQRQVVDVLHQAVALQLAHEVLHLLEVAVAQRARVGEQFRHLLQAAEKRGLLEGEVQFGGVQDLHDDHLVALVAQMLQAGEDVVEFVEAVGEQHDDAAA